MFYVLKSSDVLDILVPILYYLNDARADQCKLIQMTLMTMCLLNRIKFELDWIRIGTSESIFLNHFH